MGLLTVITFVLTAAACASSSPDAQEPDGPDDGGVPTEASKDGAAHGSDAGALADGASDAGDASGGDGGRSPLRSTIATSQVHTCAILDDHSVKCWGNSEYGELGLGGTTARGDGPNEMGNALPAVKLGAAKAVSLAAGGWHTCALLDDQSIKCWGVGFHGQLGIGRQSRGDGPNEMGDALPAVSLGTGRSAIGLAAGNRHTCAILDDGSVKCWGNGEHGELGLGDKKARGENLSDMGDALPAVNLGQGRKAVGVAAGFEHTCAILDDHSVKCWGRNASGQLGLGNITSWGDDPDEMGDALPAVNLGQGRKAVDLTAGLNHTCAVLDDHSVKCWGDGYDGQLGLGDREKRGDGPNDMSTLPAVKLGTGRTAVSVAAGSYHTCALLDDASIKCWGANSSEGKLGLEDDKWRGFAPGQMGDALPAVDLGTGRTALSLATRLAHTCAVLDDHSVKCWGRNDVGQLGIGDVTSRGAGPGEMGDALPAVDLGTGRTALAP